MTISADLKAQSVVKVSQAAWLGLTQNEQSAIQKKYVVELAELSTFGIIIDNQGVNESTYGTNAGANLGGAIADAAYIDKALKTGNYSAKNQLATGILGALLGSTLDSKPNAQFHFRYAVKLSDGEIRYFDEVKGDAFRHPVGVCISVPIIALIDQQLCSQTAASLRASYLGILATPSVESTQSRTTTSAIEAPPQAPTKQVDSIEIINCKLGTLAPVRTTAEKCRLINGSQIQ